MKQTFIVETDYEGDEGSSERIRASLERFTKGIINSSGIPPLAKISVTVPSPKEAEEAFEEFVKEKGIILSEEEKESSFEFFLGGFRSLPSYKTIKQ